MSRIKGPAIAEDTFKVSGHCCGVRTDHIGEDQGFPFELTPEARKQLEAQGMNLPSQKADDGASAKAPPTGSEK